jgi:CRISPR-associated protein (TIGR03984 family)
MITLHWTSAKRVSLPAAIEAAELPDGTIGMVSTTAWHGFVRAAGGVPTVGVPTVGVPTGVVLAGVASQVDPETVFEARLFTGNGVELRWLHQAGGLGRAVLLAEDKANVSRAKLPFDSPGSQAVHEVFEQTMLLWGTPDGPVTGGWLPLREHRVGTLHVPWSQPRPADGERVQLRLREYLAEDGYGNAYVFDELLLDLTVAKPVRWTNRDNVTGEGSAA